MWLLFTNDVYNLRDVTEVNLNDLGYINEHSTRSFADFRDPDQCLCQAAFITTRKQ